MNELININTFDIVDNMVANFNRIMNYDYLNTISALNKVGFKRIIKRPHNIITNKDENGKIVGYTIETVYTPFSKEDVSITVKDNSLFVTCGKENKEKTEGSEYLYNGVSYQSYSFSIPLDETIDVKTITAKADDGMLRVTLPLKVVEEKKDEPLTITVQ